MKILIDNKQVYLLLIFPIFGMAMEHRLHPAQIQAMPSICQISFSSPSPGNNSSGTGFHISPQQVITNFHVLEELSHKSSNLTNIVLSSPQIENSSLKRIEKIIALSAEHDLALLEVSPPSHTHLNIRRHPPTGDEMLFISGYPQQQFTEIRNIGKTQQFRNFYYFPISVSKTLNGASGSPIFDQEGKVLGVLSKASGTFAFSTHLKNVQKLLRNTDMKCKSNNECIKRELNNLRRLAKQGSAQAQYHIGLFTRDKGLSKAALPWFKKSAKKGHPQAQFALGMMYFEGDGMGQPNYKLAMLHFKKASMQGYLPAQLQLIKMYMAGKGMDKPDHQQAIRLLQPLAQAGAVHAQFGLGLMYLEKGVDRPNYPLARKWLKKATEAGLFEAQQALLTSF